MSKRALEFVETWVSEHIYPEDSPPQVDVSVAKALAASCRAAANAAGISDAEIEEQFDNLTAFIAGQIEERLINYRQRMTNAPRSKKREAPSLSSRRDPDSRAGLRGGLHAGFLRLQRRPRAQIPRPARRRRITPPRAGAPRELVEAMRVICEHRCGAG